MHGSIRDRGDEHWQVRVSLGFGRDPSTGRYDYVARSVSGTKRRT